MKKIIGVNFAIPSLEGDEYLSLDGRNSLSEGDIVIFLPNFDVASYKTSFTDPSYAGKMLYDEESSSRIYEHMEHWCEEISQYLKSGKTFVLLLDSVKEFFVHTGRERVSGTGKSQKVSSLVAKKNNYDFIPFKIPVISSSGFTVYPSNPLVQDFYNNFKKYIHFNAYISNNENHISLFTSKNKDRILGSHLNYENGNILLFPMIDFEGDHFLDKDGYWTDRAIEVGLKFREIITEIDNNIVSKSKKSPSPNWIKKKGVQLVESERIEGVILQKRKRVDNLQEELSNLEKKLLDIEEIKDLLFETGKPLENAVTKSLEILGYKAENYNDGTLELDQVIVSPEGQRFIGECEGKDNKAIDIDKFRQLQDSLNEDFARDEVEEKAFGLLFGNPKRLTDPVDRDIDFTKKCINAAKRESIGLIKTVDLFRVVRYLMENDDKKFKLKCREAISHQLGKIIKFPKIIKKKVNK